MLFHIVYDGSLPLKTKGSSEYAKQRTVSPYTDRWRIDRKQSTSQKKQGLPLLPKRSLSLSPVDPDFGKNHKKPRKTQGGWTKRKSLPCSRETWQLAFGACDYGTSMDSKATRGKTGSAIQPPGEDGAIWVDAIQFRPAT